METFYSFFPYTKKEHLMKPNGLIPYTFYKEFGYESHIVTYNIDEYDDENIKGVNFDFIKKVTGNPLIDVSFFIIKNAKKIDILHKFFWGKENYIWFTLYKMLNRNGKIYVTMDADERIKSDSMKMHGIKGKIKTYFLKKCNLISTETVDIYKWLKEYWYKDIKYVPYGVISSNKKIEYENKENLIITVGRIGTYQKATEILLQAYKKVYLDIPNWKLKIIGPIEEKFKLTIKEFFNKNPELEEKVEFLGALYNREKLMNEYEKAKIFCLTSRYESFGLVLSEAGSRGCYIVASDLAPARDLTDNKKYGSLFEIDNVDKLANILKNICNNESLMKNNCEKIQEYINKNFTWKSVCEKALSYLKEKNIN